MNKFPNNDDIYKVTAQINTLDFVGHAAVSIGTVEFGLLVGGGVTII
jgi:hypothetical protein